MPARLKSLELQGYKTFANRTLFEFGETITAIVGPNGSGKSNVADSLRWVLGEQSYSLLRARKSEDLIYSGSDSRSRAGLAFATITFDNSDGWLPIDFSEVAITRRAYRDGQNEYLINGQRVRLKDVSELLSESGLAERTYTVIGQGLVDAALSLRADERRRLFEEAAGIGLHRSRREESLRRLEQTQRNMERVEDILAELKPRLNSLERQARRAREYEFVRADLQALLHEWYGFHWHQSQKDLLQASEYEKQQEGRLAEALLEQEKAESGLNLLRERIQMLREDLNNWHKALSMHHSQREEAIRRLAVIEERKRSLQSQQQDDQIASENLLEEQKFAEEQTIAANNDIERLKEELAEAEQQAQIAERSLQEKQSQRQLVERDIQSKTLEISDLNALQGKLDAQLGESQDQAARLQEQVKSERVTLNKAAVRQKNALEALKEAQLFVRKAEEKIKKSDEDLNRKREKHEELDAKINQMRQRQSNQSADQARLRAETNVLAQAEAAFVGYANGTRLLLQAARESRLKGTRGALNAFLEVPAHLEKAITAALGDFLDAVLLETDPDAAMDLLEAESGRGALLPINQLTVHKTTKAMKPADGILGEAAELIQTAPEVKPVIRLLLDRVLIVKDRAAARKILAGQMDGWRAVTLNGEVFHSSGVVLSGGLEADRSLLGRERRIRELTADNERLEKEIKENETALADLLSRLDNVLTEISQLDILREAAHQEFLQLSRIRDQANIDQEKLQREIRWHEDRIEGLLKETLQRSEAAKSIKAALASQSDTITTKRQTLKQLESDLDLITLDEDQTQYAHWVTRLAVIRQSLQDAKTRLTERKASQDRIQQTHSALQNRLSKNLETFEELEKESQGAAGAENQVRDLIHELNQRIAPTELELAALEEQQAAEQKSVNDARKKASIAEHQHSQARVDLTRKQESLNSLQRRIEDDFGLVNYEYVEQVSIQTPLPLIGMVEQLPVVRKLSPDIDDNIKHQRAQLRRMGSINLDAQSEFDEVRQRHEFLTIQMADLQKAEQDIRAVILELDDLMKREFKKTFIAVAEEFKQIFTRLFGGGSARLILTDPDEVASTGIEIEARLPGRRTQSLALLSGGERSLTAASLVFALLKVSPTPFCVLDEVDAMLDEANIGRFSDLLRELSMQTQFLIVSHNRNTVQVADVIYGVTMGKDSSSQVLSLKLDEVESVID